LKSKVIIPSAVENEIHRAGTPTRSPSGVEDPSCPDVHFALYERPVKASHVELLRVESGTKILYDIISAGYVSISASMWA